MQTLAHRLAIGLKKRAPDHPSSVEALQFSLEAIINTLCTIVLALLISVVTSKTNETIHALQAFAILRAVSGGLHLKHSWTCCLASSIVANVISFFTLSPMGISILLVVSLVLAAIYAPSRIEQQTRIPPKYFPLLKLLSLVIISSGFFLHSSIVALSFTIQCILLIRRGGDKNHVEIT